MFKYLRKKRGQSTLEYAILIIIIIGALLSIQIYIKRAIQGAAKKNADDIGDQFSPGNTNVVKTKHTVGTTKDSELAGVSTSQIVGNELTNETMSSNIVDVNQEYWGN